MVESRRNFATAVAETEVETAAALSACKAYPKRIKQEPPPAPFRGTFWDDEDGNLTFPRHRQSYSLHSGERFYADSSTGGQGGHTDSHSHLAGGRATLDSTTWEEKKKSEGLALSGGISEGSGGNLGVPSCHDGGRPSERSRPPQGSTYSDAGGGSDGNADDGSGEINGSSISQDGRVNAGVDGFKLPLEQLGKGFALGAVYNTVQYPR